MQGSQLLASIRQGLSGPAIDRVTNFAIDANDADRGDLSLGVLEPLVKVAPQSARAWQLLGLAHRQEQNGPASLAAFRRAASLAPHDAQIAAGHATIAEEVGAPSVDLFRRAQSLAPGNGELILSTAAALVADGRPDDGEAMIESITDRHPEWVRGLAALANIRWMRDAAPDFDRSFAQAASKRPQDMILRFAWYRAVAQLGRWDDARQIISEGRRIAGSLPEFDAAEAYVATESGEDAQAERLFASASRIDDDGTRISHARHCLRTGRIDQAEAIATDVCKGPAAATAWPYLSLIWRMKNDPRAAWLDGDPPYITIYDLPFSSTELEQLAVCLRRLHTSRYHPAEQSLRGGTQTDGPLFMRGDPPIQLARKKVIEAVGGYLHQLPLLQHDHPLGDRPRRQPRFAGSWSVRLRSQGFHVCHTHPFGLVSSALYVSLPDEQSLGSAPAGWLELGAPPADLRLDIPAYARIEPRPGRLVLFPSTMWHGTMPFEDGERLTIAFDIAPGGGG